MGRSGAFRNRRGAALLSGIALTLAASAFGCGGPRVVRALGSQPVEDRPCTLFVSPRGRDSWPGTRDRPFRTLRRLNGSLLPGAVACLRGGRYTGATTLSRGGTPGQPVLIRPFRRESVILRGRLHVTQDADDVTLYGLYLDGRNRRRLPSPTINGDRVRFLRNDVTNRHTAACFVIGSPRYGRAHGTVLERNRIHDCGRVPATNYDHGVYVAAADDTRIVGNWIYDNADRGIQLYPDSQRTLIRGNVIARNGSGIILSGDHGKAASDTLIARNAISDSRLRYNIESFYPVGTRAGVRNRVVHNCIGGGRRAKRSKGGVQRPRRGFSLAADNLLRRPVYAAPDRDNFRLRAPRRCKALVGLRASRPGPLASAP